MLSKIAGYRAQHRQVSLSESELGQQQTSALSRQAMALAKEDGEPQSTLHAIEVEIESISKEMKDSEKKLDYCQSELDQLHQQLQELDEYILYKFLKIEKLRFESNFERMLL